MTQHARTTHWDEVYAAKGDLEVSWFEPEPVVSLTMLERAGLRRDSRIIDIGGGNSRLVDGLLARGLTSITVLDVSATALERTRRRLGELADVPRWVVADVTSEWGPPAVDIWHDRAVFHFLTDPDERQRYLTSMTSAVRAGGAVVMATFGPDGPEKCSGLPVVRYTAETLALALGPAFRLQESVERSHQTPWGTSQAFQYARFIRS